MRAATRPETSRTGLPIRTEAKTLGRYVHAGGGSGAGGDPARLGRSRRAAFARNVDGRRNGARHRGRDRSSIPSAPRVIDRIRVKAGAEEQGVMATVVDTVSTMGTAVGCLVGATIGVSYYTHSTKQLEEALEKGEHVPGALKDTPLKQALDYAFGHLLEFRQWADGLEPGTSTPSATSSSPIIWPRCTFRTPWCWTWTSASSRAIGAGSAGGGRSNGPARATSSSTWRSFTRSSCSAIRPRCTLTPSWAAGSAEVPRRAPGEERVRVRGRRGTFRDLTKLNRDVGMVLYITARPKTSMRQENVVQIQSPYIVDSEGRTAGGDGPDTTLLDLMPFSRGIDREAEREGREGGARV